MIKKIAYIMNVDSQVALAKLIKHPDNEVKQSMCRAVQYTCEHLPQGVAFLPTSAAKVGATVHANRFFLK